MDRESWFVVRELCPRPGSRFCVCGWILSCFHTRGVPNGDGISKFLMMGGIGPRSRATNGGVTWPARSDLERAAHTNRAEDFSYQLVTGRFPIRHLNPSDSHCGTGTPEPQASGATLVQSVYERDRKCNRKSHGRRHNLSSAGWQRREPASPTDAHPGLCADR